MPYQHLPSEDPWLAMLQEAGDVNETPSHAPLSREDVNHKQGVQVDKLHILLT